jgi:hypothetical protein
MAEYLFLEKLSCCCRTVGDTVGPTAYLSDRPVGGCRPQACHSLSHPSDRGLVRALAATRFRLVECLTVVQCRDGDRKPSSTKAAGFGALIQRQQWRLLRSSLGQTVGLQIRGITPHLRRSLHVA